MSDPELIAAAVEASGLSARRFAVALLARDERTVRRWLAGDPLPVPARDWLARFVALPDRARAAVVRALSA